MFLLVEELQQKTVKVVRKRFSVFVVRCSSTALYQGWSGTLKSQNFEFEFLWVLT